jgi:hypothetical protein
MLLPVPESIYPWVIIILMLIPPLFALPRQHIGR